MEAIIRQLRAHIDPLIRQPGPVLIAIDGSCAAGKTTLAAALAEIYDCNLFHMDDFFLRPCQRTPERFAEPGGNVDYERFAAEVLEPLKSGQPFSYQPFDCKTFRLSDPIQVIPKKLSIIEGSYSHHPYFQNPYTLKIYLTVSRDTQRQRILRRPIHLHRRFFQEWIPMEQTYFAHFQIQDKSDLILP